MIRMNMPRMNVYCYRDPSKINTDTGRAVERWVAARDEASADAAAKERGWLPDGGLLYTDTDCALGIDVIVE